MKLLTYLIILTVLGCGHKLTPEEQKEFKNRYQKAGTGVQDWIKKYALYPDSYEPISFGEYSESSTLRHDEKVPNSEKYIIHHTHKILDKDSNLITFSGYFFMDNDYYIGLIETEKSNSIGGAFPPKTHVWTGRFGRPLNKQDSFELDQRQKQVLDKFVKDIKVGLDRGDIYTGDPDDMDKLKDLLDTLEKKK